MPGTPLATAFVRIIPEPGSLERGLATESAAARAPVITPRVNTEPAEGQLREFVSGVGGKLLGALAIGEVLKSGFEAQQDYQRGLAQLEAGLKSTGDTAGLTAEDMEKLADKISGYSGQNRNTIVSTEQLLLTFTKIKDAAGENNDVFTQATQLAADMAARFGGDASASAIQLGKALNDPITGLTALRRVGVSFDQDQVTLIKHLAATGDTLGAQKIILAELTKEFGGSAKAVGETLPGELNKAKHSFEELSSELVSSAAPALDLVFKGVDTVGKAFFGGVKFLNDHKVAVAAVVTAYAALKWEAIADAVITFTARAGGALKTFAVAALGGESALRALGSGSLLRGGIFAGAGLAAVGSAALILDGLANAADNAKKKIEEIQSANPSDTGGLFDAGGAEKQLEELQGLFDAATSHNKSYLSTFTGLFSGSTFTDKALLDKLPQLLSDISSKTTNYKEEVAGLAKQFGLTTDEVVKFGKAWGLDLSDAKSLADGTAEVTAQFEKHLGALDNVTHAQDLSSGARLRFIDATDKYNILIGKTNTALGGQIDLLAGVDKQSQITGAQLLQNAQDALKAFQDESTNIQELTKKGLDPATIKALVDKGPQFVSAANQLSLTDLKTFGKTYQDELKAQWGRSATVTGLGATAADRKAIDAIIAGQGAMDGATGKIAASITTAFLHEHPKAYAAAQDLYTVVQGEVDKLHGKDIQILLDDLASGNIAKLKDDLNALTTQLATLQQTNVLGVPGVQLMLNNPRFQADGGIETHSAQIAPAGAWRVWAEPETGGEAYIPLAPSKRARSVDIWKQVGHHLGVTFDTGGIIAPTDLASIDRTYRWTLNDEPLVGKFANFDGHIKNALGNLGSLAAGAGGALPAGDAVNRWAPLVLQVLGMLGQSAAWLPNVLRQIATESGGNPNAINLWDSNAAKGVPSKGILQTIDPTFYAYAGPYAALGPYNPLADTYAGLNYALNRYGSLGALGQGHGYDNGGPLMPGWTMAYNGTGKPENVSTHDSMQDLVTEVRALRAELAALDRNWLHIENWHGDQTDANGLASQAAAHHRAATLARRL